MQNGYEFNAIEFITAGGPVSVMVALVLLAMSLASWYLIVVKTLQAVRLSKAIKDYTEKFWNARNLQETSSIKSETGIAILAAEAIAAAEHHQQHTSHAAKISQDEFVARAMNRSIAEQNAKMEAGLTVLASVGSISPFVGLFGTVWGIYHALAGISQSGQATLDKVAGPVGEALIMTALGLAVAIPAVLAYNAFVRSNRVFSAAMEKFGYELHTLLTTGAVIGSQPQNAATPAANMTRERIHAVEITA